MVACNGRSVAGEGAPSFVLGTRPAAGTRARTWVDSCDTWGGPLVTLRRAWQEQAGATRAKLNWQGQRAPIRPVDHDLLGLNKGRLDFL